MDLRTEFVGRVLKGERVTDLCREYGISRKTGDKFKQRFVKYGEAGLGDRPRSPHVVPHRTSTELVSLIVAERKRHPSWGPKKLKEVLERRLEHRVPAASTIGDILTRQGLTVRRPRRARPRAVPTALREACAPNDLWCIDYKGQFRLGDRTYCYPLTITDQFSRYVLCCEAMPAIRAESARDWCEETFRAHGLPSAIRSDNGAPFASTGLLGLSKLSVYWMRLGIACERIRPSHPEENGRHERMHRTLKFETTRPARTNLLQQQERFDNFVHEFNHERPHEAIGMKFPAELYVASKSKYPESLPEIDYPDHDDTLRVNHRGEISLAGRNIHVSQALAGENIGIREERNGRWRLSFMHTELGVVEGRSVNAISAAS